VKSVVQLRSVMAVDLDQGGVCTHR
jgi:hypothetical protein